MEQGEKIYQNIVSETKKEKGKKLLEMAKLIHNDALSDQTQALLSRTKYFFQNGSWRETNPDREIISYYERIQKDIDINTLSCFQNAYLICKRLKEDGYNAEYCEGFALPKYGGIPQTHSWIEVDEQVLEVTWPWSGPDPDEMCVYYGCELDWFMVLDRQSDRPTYSSALIDDSTYYSISSVQKSIQNM